MGSRILSRSFNVETVDINAAETGTEEASDPPSMDVDQDEVTEREEDSDDDDDEENNVSDVSMVPMADLLNARYGSENVCLLPCTAGRNSSILGQIVLRTGRTSHDIDKGDQSERADCTLSNVSCSLTCFDPTGSGTLTVICLMPNCCDGTGM